MVPTEPCPEPHESSPYFNVNIFGVTLFHVVLSV
jgi:hypothetical protein